MDFYKLDKIDKIVISIIFIFVAMFSILNNFVFAANFTDTEISPTDINGIDFQLDSSSFFSSPSGRVHYISVIPGSTYRIYNNSTGARLFAFSSDAPSVGVEILSTFSLEAGGTSGRSDYITIPEGANYLYLSTTYNSQNVWFYLVDSGLQLSIDTLVNNVSGILIWDSIVSALPFILVCTVFGLGSLFVHRLIKSGSRGKAKLF